MEDLFALLDDKAGTERRFIVAFCKVIYLYIIDSDTALLYQPSDLALGGGKPHLDHQIRQRNGSIGDIYMCVDKNYVGERIVIDLTAFDSFYIGDSEAIDVRKVKCKFIVEDEVIQSIL